MCYNRPDAHLLQKLVVLAQHVYETHVKGENVFHPQRLGPVLWLCLPLGMKLCVTGCIPLSVEALRFPLKYKLPGDSGNRFRDVGKYRQTKR